MTAIDDMETVMLLVKTNTLKSIECSSEENHILFDEISLFRTEKCIYRKKACKNFRFYHFKKNVSHDNHVNTHLLFIRSIVSGLFQCLQYVTSCVVTLNFALRTHPTSVWSTVSRYFCIQMSYSTSVHLNCVRIEFF